MASDYLLRYIPDLRYQRYNPAVVALRSIRLVERLDCDKFPLLLRNVLSLPNADDDVEQYLTQS